MPKLTRSEVVDCLAQYLADCPAEDIDKEAKRLISETKRMLKYEEEQKKKRATKEYLVRQYEYFARVNLEKAPWFVRWLDKLNPQGQQMFLAQCTECGGKGKQKAIIGDHLVTCSNCGGAGKVEGPLIVTDAVSSPSLILPTVVDISSFPQLLFF